MVVRHVRKVHLLAAVHRSFALVGGAEDLASFLPILDCYIDLVDSDGDIAGLLGFDQ